DGAVATKRGELQRILNHMGGLYPKNIWILAGYLNMATSSYSLNSALEAGSISKQTRTSLDHMEMMLREAGLVDSWVAARIEAGESSDDAKRAKSLSDVFEGEQGATFDPRENARAAAMVGSGFNNRPQRYDRIFLKGLDILSVGGFNMFGFVTDHAETGDTLGSRIVKSASQGIRLLRKVKSKSGTMLILEVQGVKADLHYCQAPHIAEKWPDVMKRPPSDPAFDLKFESLLKLKPARDLFYLRRSIPDLAQFRIAYQLVKEWRRHEASMAQGSAT
ncbi:hypothetical protein ACHAQH_006968, partial [Verticillium albo-atrum]